MKKKYPLVVDMHTHIRVPALFDYMKANPITATGPGTEDWYVPNSTTNRGGNLIEREDERAAVATLPKPRLAAMDKQGVDIQIISVNYPVTCSWMPADKGLHAAKIANNAIAEFCAFKPDRFAGVGVVPLQTPELAAAELERCVTELGLRGAWITSHSRGEDIGEKKFRPFWAKAEALGVPVFVHPLGPSDITRMKEHFLFNIVGQPLEETLATCSLIYEGIMDDYPKLKVGICHGGGYLPYYSGRSDWAYDHDRGQVRAKIKHRPSSYISKFYYDTIVFDPDMLPVLIKKAGVDKVLLGSDWPAVSEDAIALVESCSSISDEDKARIIWKNSAALFGITT